MKQWCLRLLLGPYFENVVSNTIEFLFILKVANIRYFILIVVEIFHNIIRK